MPAAHCQGMKFGVMFKLDRCSGPHKTSSRPDDLAHTGQRQESVPAPKGCESFERPEKWDRISPSGPLPHALQLAGSANLEIFNLTAGFYGSH
jgi:hypothetical protein